MDSYCQRTWSLFLVTLLSIHYTTGIPFPKPSPAPAPQLLPGQIPSHIASHPALSSVAQGKESALLQFAYNTQNRRGPSPSPLVLQNNQERNLQLVNQFNSQRSGGQQPFLAGGAAPLNPGVPGGHNHAHDQGNPQNKELRALEEIAKYKSGASPASASSPQQGSGQNAYAPLALTTAEASHYGYQNQHQHANGIPPGVSGASPDDNDREDIKKLKSILNLAAGGRPVAGHPSGSFGSGGQPQIGVAGERGILHPGQHGHGHNQGPNAVGNLQYGQGRHPGTPSPVVNLPYNGGANPHTHQGHHQDAKTIIEKVDTPEHKYKNIVYIDPVRQPTSINKQIEPGQSLFVLPASDYTSDDFQRLLNRPAEILIDVLPADSETKSGAFELHNFVFQLTPSSYARCSQATHKRGYGGKCKLILKVSKNAPSYTQPVTVSYQ